MSKQYMILPSPVQDSMVSLWGWHTQRARYGKIFKAASAGYLQREKWSEQKLLEYQKQQVAKVLREASMTPHYSAVFQRIGAEWQDLLEPSAFRQLPPLHKVQIQRDPDSFRPRPRQRGDRVVKTSGTTGTSLTLPVSSNVEIEQWAVWWRYRQAHQIRRGTWMALFASTPIVPEGELRRFWRANIPGREWRFSVYHISSSTCRQYVEALNRLQPAWIHGNPSAISLLASYMVEQQLTLDYKLRWLTVGSENMQPWQRTAIEQAFGVSPIQHYGLAEAAANISECECGNLHIDEDFSYVELVPYDGGPQHMIVGTPFANRAAVLLRYHTGDLARPLLRTCSCGRSGRLVAAIDGRETDYIMLPSGNKVASLASPFHSTTGLAEAQIHQDQAGELTIRYVPGHGWHDGVLAELEQRLRDRVGNAVPLRFRQVEKVERTARGKIKLVISEYNRER